VANVIIYIEDTEGDVSEKTTEEIKNAVISLLLTKGVEKYSVKTNWISKIDSIKNREAVGRWVDSLFDN